MNWIDSIFEKLLYITIVVVVVVARGVLDFGLDGGVPPGPRDPNPCLE